MPWGGTHPSPCQNAKLSLLPPHPARFAFELSAPGWWERRIKNENRNLIVPFLFCFAFNLVCFPFSATHQVQWRLKGSPTPPGTPYVKGRFRLGKTVSWSALLNARHVFIKMPRPSRTRLDGVAFHRRQTYNHPQLGELLVVFFFVALFKSCPGPLGKKFCVAVVDFCS